MKEIELKDDILNIEYWEGWQLHCAGRLTERSCDWCPRTYIVQINDNSRYRQWCSEYCRRKDKRDRKFA